MLSDDYKPGDVLCMGGPLDGRWFTNPEVTLRMLNSGYQLMVLHVPDEDAVGVFAHSATYPVRDAKRLEEWTTRARDTYREAELDYEAAQAKAALPKVTGNVASEEDDG